MSKKSSVYSAMRTARSDPVGSALKHRLGYVLCLFYVCLSACCAIQVQAQLSASPDSVVTVSTSPDLRNYWRIQVAGIKEELSTTNGYLVLENTSGTTIDRSLLYAEYFDSADRFCFSLTFSLSKNIGDRTPVAPGETRTVYSADVGLAPASRPNHARVYLLTRATSQNAVPASHLPTIRAPATLNTSIPADAATLKLSPELGTGKAPTVDLLLAELRVNDHGEVTKTRILNSASAALEEWFLNFVRILSFYPATISNTPVDSVALVNVTALLSKEGSASAVVSASDLAWVKQYAAQFSGDEFPPVTQIVFWPPSTKIQLPGSSEYTERPPAPAGTMELLILGSEWSNPSYEWVRDESMPHHLRRKLADSEIPR